MTSVLSEHIPTWLLSGRKQNCPYLQAGIPLLLCLSAEKMFIKSFMFFSLENEVIQYHRLFVLDFGIRSNHTFS